MKSPQDDYHGDERSQHLDETLNPPHVRQREFIYPPSVYICTCLNVPPERRNISSVLLNTAFDTLTSPRRGRKDVNKKGEGGGKKIRQNHDHHLPRELISLRLFTTPLHYFGQASDLRTVTRQEISLASDQIFHAAGSPSPRCGPCMGRPTCEPSIDCDNTASLVCLPTKHHVRQVFCAAARGHGIRGSGLHTFSELVSFDVRFLESWRTRSKCLICRHLDLRRSCSDLNCRRPLALFLEQTQPATLNRLRHLQRYQEYRRRNKRRAFVTQCLVTRIRAMPTG